MQKIKSNTKKLAAAKKPLIEPGNDNQRGVIAILQECHNSCREMFMEYAPKESGRNLSHLHLKRLQACIDICGGTASYLLKDGVRANRLCEIAAHICEQCADSCEKLEDEHFQDCAELCREAAEACLEESHRLKQAA